MKRLITHLTLLLSACAASLHAEPVPSGKKPNIVWMSKQLSDWRVTQNDHVRVYLTEPYVAPGRGDPVTKANE